MAYLLVRIKAQNDVGEFGQTNFFTGGKFFSEWKIARIRNAKFESHSFNRNESSHKLLSHHFNQEMHSAKMIRHTKKMSYYELFFEMIAMFHILGQPSYLLHFTFFAQVKNFPLVKKIGFAKFSHIILSLYSNE